MRRGRGRSDVEGIQTRNSIYFPPPSRRSFQVTRMTSQAAAIRRRSRKKAVALGSMAREIWSRYALPGSAERRRIDGLPDLVREGPERSQGARGCAEESSPVHQRLTLLTNCFQQICNAFQNGNECVGVAGARNCQAAPIAPPTCRERAGFRLWPRQIPVGTWDCRSCYPSAVRRLPCWPEYRRHNDLHR